MTCTKCRQPDWFKFSDTTPIYMHWCLGIGGWIYSNGETEADNSGIEALANQTLAQEAHRLPKTERQVK